jgi:hypothetical protein
VLIFLFASSQDIPGSCHVLSPPLLNYSIGCFGYYGNQTQLLLAPGAIRPVSNPLVSTCGPWENTVMLKCRHPHFVALSFYIMSLMILRVSCAFTNLTDLHNLFMENRL